MLHTDYMTTAPAYREALRAAGLERVANVLNRVDGEIVAWSRTTDCMLVRPDPRSVGFYVKRYFYPTWRSRLRGFFRGTFLGVHRAKAEARTLNTMRNLGIPAVRPIAWGWRRIGHFIAACFIITEAVPDAPNLTTYAQSVAAGEITLTPARRRAMVGRLAQVIADMHTAGFAHGRLFWRNVLIDWSPTGEPEFTLLDAEPPKRIERLGLGGRWWLWELAKMAVSAMPFSTRTERLRFMQRYLAIIGLSGDAKAQIHEVSRLSQQWRQHELQRIRMNRRFINWGRQLDAERAAAAQGPA